MSSEFLHGPFKSIDRTNGKWIYSAYNFGIKYFVFRFTNLVENQGSAQVGNDWIAHVVVFGECRHLDEKYDHL